MADRLAIGKTGGETRLGRFVPPGKTECLGETAHSCLVDLQLRQGGAHTGITGRLNARTMVTEVIQVDPIENLSALRCFGNRPELTVQLPFAGVTTIRGIAAVGRILEFTGFHLAMLHL